MSQFRVSRSATTDLEDIWVYIAVDNREAADRFVQRLTLQFQKLASMPGIGRKREELAEGLRSFAVANYVIFYRTMEGGVEIDRVLHGARDFPPLFS